MTTTHVPLVHPFLRAAKLGLKLDDDWIGYLQEGPPPTLRRREQVRLALWCARRVERFLNVEERAYVRGLDGAVQAWIDGNAEAADKLARAETDAPPLHSAPAVAVFAMAAAATRRRRAPTRVVRAAVLRTARILAADQEAIDFLVGLEGEMLRLELCGAVSRRVPDAATRVQELVYRGHDGVHSRVWLARLDGEWGVLVRAGGLKWTVGTRDDVAALVPDRWFEPATSALLASERKRDA